MTLALGAMQPGQVVADRFEIRAVAGSGGMGTVYRARDRHDGAEVALKVLAAAEGSRAERFAREARVLAELTHPGLVRYIAHGVTPSGERYLAMEWLDGVDLSERLGQGPLAIADAVTLVRRVAQALAVAHAAGIVHRDIKPSNLFLPGGQVDRVKVLDFGVARWRRGFGDHTRTGHRVGTPRYMAPEQVRGAKDLDARVDVFALGCVLFACLAGRAAFTGDDEMAVLAKILLEEPPRVAELRPEVSPALENLVGRMLAKDPHFRPENAGALVEELEALGDAEVSGAAGVPRAPALTTGEQRLMCVIALAGVAPTGTGSSSASASPSGTPTPSPSATPASVDGPPTTVMKVETPLDRMRSIAWQHGGNLERLADGTLLTVIAGTGAATDLAAAGARCALALRAVDPTAPMALSTGRGVVGAATPLGEVIDRVAQLLRLEQEQEWLLEPGQPRPIRVGETTTGLLDARFDVDGDPVGLILRGERQALEVVRTLLGKPTPCVGRDLELATLEGIVSESIGESVARAILVTSRAGVGKSRLRYELLRRLRGKGEPLEIWVGRGDPLRVGSPFGLLAPAIRRAAGIHDGEPVHLAQQRLRGRLARNLSGPDLSRVVEFIGELTGIPFPEEESVQLAAARRDPLLMGDQMRRAWEDLVVAEAGARPFLLVLEDVHWGDLPTVRFVDGALRSAADRPFMVLALARPEVDELFPRMWEGRPLTRLEIGELSRKAAEKLVRHALPDADAALVDAIVERAAGNAFFLEELIRAVADGATLEAAPKTVLAMVQARLEQLPAEARRVLRAASVFGQAFWPGAVTALLGGDARAADVNEWIADLVGRELVTRRLESKFPGQDELVFRNGLVREAAYAMLTETDRELGHRLAGGWLEDNGESDFMLLGEHFERGAAARRAVPWYLLATEQALEANDLVSVFKRADRGIRCGADGEDLARLELILAEAYGWRGQLAEAERAARAAIEGLPRGTALWFVAAGEFAGASGRLGHYDQLEAVAHLLLGALQRAGDDPDRSLAVSSCRTASALLFAGRYDLGQQVLEAVEKRGAGLSARDPGVAAALHRSRAIRALAAGDQAAGLRHWPAAVESHERAGDLRAATQARGNLANRYKELGGYAQAERLLAEVRVAADRLNLTTVVTLAKHNLGLILAYRGELEAARAIEGEAAAEFMSAGDRRLEAASRGYLALILGRLGVIDAAEYEAETAVALSRTTPPAHAQSLACLARVRLLRGPDGAAEALKPAREAMRILDSLGALDEGESLVRLAHAEALMAAGLKDEAIAAIRRARDRLVAMAQKIAEPAWCWSFLENVPENRATLALATAWAVV